MKRPRFLFVSALLCCAVGLLGPATASANAGSYTIVVNKCQVAPLNGSLGYGLKLKVTLKDDGSTTVDWLQIKSRVERKSGSSWVTKQVFADVDKYYNANGQPHSLTVTQSFGWGSPPDNNTYRIQFKLATRDSNFGGLTEYTHTVNGKQGPGNGCQSI